MSTSDAGLIHAYRLDGKGGGVRVGWKDVRAWEPEDGHLWVHLDMQAEGAERWLRQASGIEEHACDALLADATRPQARPSGTGLLVVLRGVNLNPGADPEDMVAIRVVVHPKRFVSVSRRRLMAVTDTTDELEAGTGPEGVGGLLTVIAEKLLERMTPTLDQLGDEVDAQEEDAVQGAPHDLQASLAELRRQVIALRRHLAPQREAMARLVQECAGTFDADDLATLQGVADQVTRHVEDLDELRERTAVTEDLLTARQAEGMNQRMLILSVITAIFLPLGLITGLLGINVGGIPGSASDSAFLVVCGLLALIAVLQLVILRKMKWF